ncbi:ribosome silencing factor [candidate division KSB1 bacterium]|nr:MAG: ribosome silencing factor [candidate division KSB1 bacterium]
MRGRTLTDVSSQTLAENVAAAALEKKATDVVILDLRKLEAVTDFFVICSGDVDQHVRAIVRHIEDQVKTRLGERVLHREGMESLHWVLLDYVNVVVHVFRPSFREFYRLEDLWGDAKLQRIHEEKDLAITAKPTRRKPTAPASKKTRTAATPRGKTTSGTKTKTGTAKKPAAKETVRKSSVKKTVKKISRKKES